MSYVIDLVEELLQSGWQCWRIAKELNDQNIVIAFDENTHHCGGGFPALDDFYLTDEVPMGMNTIKVSREDIELLRQTTN